MIELIKSATANDWLGWDFERHSKRGVTPTLKNIVDTIYSVRKPNLPGPWIAGGMGRQLVRGETEFNDIDVWFNNAEQLHDLNCRFQQVFLDNCYCIYSSPNAETLQVGDFKVQFIRKQFYRSVEEIFDNFDFTCCQIAVDENIQAYGPGIEDAKNSKLKLNQLDRHGFIYRYAKYLGYGFKMDPEEFLEVIEKGNCNYEFDGNSLGY